MQRPDTIGFPHHIYYANIQSYLQYVLCVWGPMLNSKMSKRILNKLKTVKKLLPATSHVKMLSFDDLQKVELAKLSYRYTNKMIGKSI